MEVRPGDRIKWKEPVFRGTYRRAQFVGERTVTGVVTNHWYEMETGYHWFTIQVQASEGVDPLPAGKKIRRRGKNVYFGLLEHELDPSREREAPPPPGGKFLPQRTCTRCGAAGANAERLCKVCWEAVKRGEA